MLIWLQNEFVSKLHIIVIFILLINQERVVVIKLLMKTMEKRKVTRKNMTDYYQYCLKKTLFKTKKGHLENLGFKQDQDKQQTRAITN